MLYLQKYLTNFSKLFFWLKDEEGGYSGWKFQEHRLFWFSISNVTTFPTSRKCKNFNYSRLHYPRRNAISSKVFNEFSETFFWMKDEEAGHCGRKFQVRRCCGFAIATLPLFLQPENVKVSIFPFRLSQQKCIYLQRYLPNCSKTFFST